MLYLVEQYKKAQGVEEIDLTAVAQWAIEQGRYRREPIDPLKALRRELVRALRSEHLTDAQGREVRKNHPVVMSDGQHRMSIWAEIFQAKPRHMRLSLSQRRQGILADCRQHKLDFDSYNDNNVYDQRLPAFDYNFNADLEEMDLPTDYPEES